MSFFSFKFLRGYKIVQELLTSAAELRGDLKRHF